ncbi:aliphatic sulfonate ABC transporter substrate-binding protein [Methylosinus sp. H3A]|uniref:aliphatic sulfonate ABC transporter substrate-binding protein n=1 Tax=Methylosinus sp. H3A TaxID=2785786 RepID=UPI0018C3102B|nr:aliphatic sulfonate ABC transporter substrate-binding protein [Methylosinus sp. H3A]MBG0809954.1 aliphatic sulfonate ABC transporter substrate-binding protein [Methylosinus sp. H3A]
MERPVFDRRAVLFAAAAAVTTATSFEAATAPEKPKELLVGYQKFSVLLVAKARKLLEKRLEPRGFTVKWVEFPFGPPMLEALGAGAIDYGYTGDAPPVFAQAAHGRLVYAAAIPAKAYGQGVIVPRRSAIERVADLKGKRIGVAKASSAHNLLISTLESADIEWEDIRPVYLAPADAAAAFTRGAIDAWSIWDPYLAIAELNADARQLEIDVDAATQSSFFLANADFAARYPVIVGDINDEIARAAEWAAAHRDEVAALYAEASGVPLAAQRKSVDRAEFALVSIDDAIIARQQRVADRFLRLELIPARVDIRDIVWKRRPAG